MLIALAAAILILIFYAKSTRMIYLLYTVKFKIIKRYDGYLYQTYQLTSNIF